MRLVLVLAALVAALSFVAVAPTVAQTPYVSADLTAAEVESWCIRGCEFHRFEELEEGGRTIVHMTTGLPATLLVPEGVSADGWDCYVPLFAAGPIEIGLCEATFRRI